MTAVQWCQSFYEFAGTVCRYAAKRCLIKARPRCLPVLHCRTFSGTSYLEHWKKRNTDAAKRPPILLTAFFISDMQWARDVIEVSGLSKSSDRHEVVVFHVNPGSGVLIESLFQSCDHKQIAWEPRKLYKDYLNSLTETYKTKFAYSNYSFSGDHQLKILDEVFPDDGTADDAAYHVKIVGSVPEMALFIPKLVLSLSRVSRSRLCRFGIIEPLLIVTGSEYRLMTEAELFWQKCKHARTALYKLFLRTELLKTVPLSAFNHAKQLSLKSTTFDYDRENLYIVRFSLRKDLASVCRCEDIVGITLLIRVINNMKSRRVIPVMERLCPDIGLVLLELGISMMDRVCDVPLNLWPEIYRAVVSSNQFSCSPLYHIFQQKQDGFFPS